MDQPNAFQANALQLTVNLKNVSDALALAAKSAKEFSDLLRTGQPNLEQHAGFLALMANPGIYLQGGAVGGINANGKRPAATDDEEENDGKKKKRVTKAKDPNAPKRPASSYLLFQNTIRKPLKEQNPELSNADLLAMISTQWQTMPKDEKNKYEEMQKAAKDDYLLKKVAYEANPIPFDEDAVKVKKPRAKRGPNKPKVSAAASPVAAAAPTPAATEDESDEDDDSEADSAGVAADVASEASEEEDEEEEEEEEDVIIPVPTAKKSKKTVAPPVPEAKVKKSKKHV